MNSRRVRVLVTGAAGCVGSELVSQLSRHLDAPDVSAADRAGLDVADRAAVSAAIASLAPEIVVNCAAWTAVDACENDPDRADRVNAAAVGHLAEACDRAGAHLVTLSSDHVFDGAKPTPYTETDEPCPRSVYGKSKRAAELLAGSEATLIRTSWVCGARGSNMVKTVLRQLASRAELRYVDDQFGHPTFASDLAALIVRLALQRQAGIFHVTNQVPVSRYAFARAIAGAAGADPDRVQPIATIEMNPPRPAPRPANGVLDNAALRATGLAPTRPFHEPLSELMALLRSN